MAYGFLDMIMVANDLALKRDAASEEEWQDLAVWADAVGRAEFATYIRQDGRSSRIIEVDRSGHSGSPDRRVDRYGHWP